MNKLLEKIKKVAMELAVDSGHFVLSKMDKIGEISFKQGHNDLVTDIDKRCEGIIIEKINKIFPDHSVLAEESGESGKRSDICWIIDPIDGTTNYTHSFPFFCISLGVSINDEVKVGVVYDPSRDELFHAARGKGAFMNKREIHVTDVDRVRDSLIATGFAYNLDGRVKILPYFEAILKHAQAVRRAGSAAMDLCYVACGRFDGFWEFGLNPWDTAAGHLLVKEAGGRVTTLDGKNYDIFNKEIVASNGVIHAQMLDLFKKKREQLPD